jgi:hypothetical protein
VTVEQRFSELYALTRRYPRLVGVAREAIRYLQAIDEKELHQAANVRDAEDNLYKRLWDSIVEPAGGRTPASENEVEDTRMMAWEGVVLDHAIHLWTAGPKWRERIDTALPAAA